MSPIIFRPTCVLLNTEGPMGSSGLQKGEQAMKTYFALFILAIAFALIFWYMNGSLLPGGGHLSVPSWGLLLSLLIPATAYGVYIFWQLPRRWLGMPLSFLSASALIYLGYLVAWGNYLASCPMAVHG